MKEAVLAAVLGFLLVSTGPLTAQDSARGAPAAAWSIPSDAAIRDILVDRIDMQHQSVGIVVGIIDSKGRRIVSYGRLNQGDARPLNGDTVFEIGSMTKVFTSLLLSDMAGRGEVVLDDPVAKYLPPSATVPERGGKKITLIDLATHTSGLPPMPNNFAPKDPDNPYADYTVDQLYQFLGSYTLTRDIGVRYEYSNLGVGLLGHALTLRAGSDYETLVRQRITGPLGMGDTAIALSPEMRARLSVGHNYLMNPVKNWDIATLSGAGALRSTANDLLNFLAAELGIVDTALKPAMTRQLSVRRPTGVANLAVALGWHVLSDPSGTVIWHNGATGGYHSFFGFDPAIGAGVVVLSNAQTATGIDDIGYHILIGKPLAKPTPTPAALRKEIPLDTNVQQRYVGRYEFAPNVVIAITFENNRLVAQLTGQGKYVIYPESETEFFWMVVDAELTFELDSDQHVMSATLHQNGRNTVAKRLDAAAP